MRPSPKHRYFINSLEKGLTVLNAFSHHKSQLGLSELAQVTSMTLGTTSRYVRTLTDLGYIVRNPKTKKYSLSPKILSLGFSLLKDMDLRTRLLPHLEQVALEMNVGAQCAILDGTEIVYVERVRVHQIVALDLTVGSRLPAYCTAMGRAILSWLDDDSIRRIIHQADFAPLTPFTKTDPKTLYKELAETRRRGYAANVQELVLGQAAFAAPVFRGNEVEGSFGFSFPSVRLEEGGFEDRLITRIKEIGPKVAIR